MKKPFVVISSVVIVLVGLLGTFFLLQNNLDNRSRAEKTVTLSFSPSSSTTDPLNVNPDDTFPLDILLNPGSNLVSGTKISVYYDASKIEPYSGIPFEFNQDAFTKLVEGPVFTPGKISFTLSVGSDPSRAIKTQMRIATIKFHALDYATSSEGPTQITFGTESQATSISSNSSPSENVISNTVPATIIIGSASETPSISPVPPSAEHPSESSITLSIPKIHCLLPSQLCTPMFVTSTQTDSVLKVNYKVPSNISTFNFSGGNSGHSGNRKGGWGNSNGGSWQKSGGKNIWKPSPIAPTPTKQPSVAGEHCSSIRVHFYVDGVKKYTSNWLGWSGAPAPYNQLLLETGAINLGPVSPGDHIVGVQAEGMTSGCNVGKLNSWAGSVTITTSSTVIPSPPPTACTANVPTDTVVIMDTSGSMNDKISSSQGTKLKNAKSAASSFVDILSSNSQNKLGLVSFGTTATLNSGLTTSYSTIKTKLNSLSAVGWTCTECSIKKASQEITAQGRPGIKKVVVLLTDGRANGIEGKSTSVATSLAEQRAITAVTNDFNAHQTVYYTIGLGQDVNTSFLRQIAEMTGGRYYFSPNSSDLNAIYQQISQVISQGSVSGFVYDDENGSGSFQTGESKLSDWTLQLLSQSGSLVQTTTTDESGAYNLSGVCGGSYTLKEVPKSGWTQTQPSGGSGYAISITNGSVQTNKNFGNKSSARCSDNIDNDANGFVDEKDSTCHTDGNPNNPNSYVPQKNGENGTNTCSDSKDNNGNGLVDGEDPICHTGGNPSNPWDPNLPEKNARCSDNIDNDNNGFKDAADSTCHTDGNPNNPGSYDPQKDGEHGGNTCADSLDNNENGLIDGADPVCHTGGNPNNPWDPNLPEISPTGLPTPTPTTIVTITPTSGPTVTTGVGTLVNLNILLHGIGSSGDNTNQVNFNLSNQNPAHTTRTASVSVYDASNTLLTSTSGSVNFDTTSGSYKGTVNLGSALTTGVYTIKVKTDQHLYRLVAGIQTLTAGQTNNLPITDLVAGDTNDDNKVNILDYNALIGCYSDLSPAISCNPTLKLQTDLTDDSSVNQVDYNLFLREIATQPGQ